MTDHLTTEALGEAAPTFCPSCGRQVAIGDTFCGSCGSATASDASGAVDGSPGSSASEHAEAVDQPTFGYQLDDKQAPGAAPRPSGAGYPPPAAGYPPPMGGYPPPPPGYPPAAYTGSGPPPHKTNTGLIVGVVGAGLAAVGVIVAVILLATGSPNNSKPVISTAAASVPAPAVTPVTPSPGTAVAPSSSSGPSPTHSSSGSGPGSSGSLAPMTPTSTSTSSPGGGSGTEAAGQAVTREWAFISASNFTAAYDLFVPGSVGGESAFVAGHQQDAPISASVSVGTPTLNSPTDASVPLLSLQTQDSVNGCKNWTGSYEMQQVSGQWLISKANIQSQPC
jgi:hypothetical protein